MLATPRTCSAGLLLLLVATLPGTFSDSVYRNDCGEGYIRRGTACLRLYSPAKDPTTGTHLTPALHDNKRGEGMVYPGSPECPEGYTKKGAHCIQIQTNLSSKKVDTAEGRVRRQTFLPGLCPPGHTRRGPFCVLLTKQEDNNKENEIHTNQSSNPEVDTAEGRVRRQTFLPGLCPPGHIRRGPFCVLLTKQEDNNKENEIHTNLSSNPEVDTAEGRARRNAFSINLCPPFNTKKDIYCVIDNQEDKKQ